MYYLQPILLYPHCHQQNLPTCYKILPIYVFYKSSLFQSIIYIMFLISNAIIYVCMSLQILLWECRYVHLHVHMKYIFVTDLFHMLYVSGVNSLSMTYKQDYFSLLHWWVLFRFQFLIIPVVIVIIMLLCPRDVSHLLVNLKVFNFFIVPDCSCLININV